MTSDISFEVNNHLAKITLNRPKALNALNYSMFEQFHAHLVQWQKDTSIKAVIARSDCEKAFCAGGDIRAIYENKHLSADDLSDYFRLEYAINLLIAHFKKPYIALTHGITMGGGIGISLHGSHCVAAENLRWAMPETLIGFFPDVGATYYLSRLPNHVGTYLALTGNAIDAQTALQLGLVKTCVSLENFDTLEKKLTETPFDSNDFDAVTKVINQFSANDLDVEKILPIKEIASTFCFSTIEEILNALSSLNTVWSQETLSQLLKRSPTSLKVAHHQLHIAKAKTIDEVIAMDFRIAHTMLEHHDFYEGVRAAVIDKDKNPKWKPRNIVDVTDEVVSLYFLEE